MKAVIRNTSKNTPNTQAARKPSRKTNPRSVLLQEQRLHKIILSCVRELEQDGINPSVFLDSLAHRLMRVPVKAVDEIAF